MLQRITKYEFDSFSAGEQNPIVKEAMGLNVDEGIVIPFEEWKLLSTPISYIYQTGKKQNKKYSLKTDKEKKIWMVLRTA